MIKSYLPPYTDDEETEFKITQEIEEKLKAWKHPEKFETSERQNSVDTGDNVNHPKHYTEHPSGVECIQVTEHMTFNCGNAVKYIWRNGLKDGNSNIQDLNKSIWYLQREIERLSKK